MKLKADRVCFSTSARARVLPDLPREETIDVPAPPKTGNMIGNTRCDDFVIDLVHVLTADNSIVRVESAGHNKLRWFGPGGRSELLPATAPTERQYEAYVHKLNELGIVMSSGGRDGQNREQLMPALSSKLGIEISIGTVYLLQQFLDSMAGDIEVAITERTKARITELEELVHMAEEEVATIGRDSAQRIKEAEHQRDELRARAEKAERALSNLTRSFREASDLVSDS